MRKALSFSGLSSPSWRRRFRPGRSTPRRSPPVRSTRRWSSPASPSRSAATTGSRARASHIRFRQDPNVSRSTARSRRTPAAASRPASPSPRRRGRPGTDRGRRPGSVGRAGALRGPDHRATATRRLLRVTRHVRDRRSHPRSGQAVKVNGRRGCRGPTGDQLQPGLLRGAHGHRQRQRRRQVRKATLHPRRRRGRRCRGRGPRPGWRWRTAGMPHPHRGHLLVDRRERVRPGTPGEPGDVALLVGTARVVAARTPPAHAARCSARAEPPRPGTEPGPLDLRGGLVLAAAIRVLGLRGRAVASQDREQRLGFGVGGLSVKASPGGPHRSPGGCSPRPSPASPADHGPARGARWRAPRRERAPSAPPAARGERRSARRRRPSPGPSRSAGRRAPARGRSTWGFRPRPAGAGHAGLEPGVRPAGPR